jgi:hypothetical protein
MRRSRFVRSSTRRFCSSRQLRFEPLEGRQLLATLYRIDAGGPELAGSPPWSADTLAAPSAFSNATTGGNSATFSTSTAIDMSHPSLPAGTPMALFQTERYDKPTGANLLWDFPVSLGQYEVRLYFAETYAPLFSTGARVFDVVIEGVTVLDNYDVFAEVGGNKGVMKSFVVASDGNLDIDFLRGVQNPLVKGIEILTAGQQAGPLNASATALDFGKLMTGQTASLQVTLTNGGGSGAAAITVDPAAASINPSGPFSVSFSQSTPIVLAPGASTAVTVAYAPTAGGVFAAALTIVHNGANSTIGISLTGEAEETPTTQLAYRINAGGASIGGATPWEGDTATAPSTYSNLDEGGNSGVYSTTATIDMSHASVPAGTPMSIFQTERFDKPTGENLLWDFPVEPGQYEVRLYFSEVYAPLFAVGARIFDVQIEGTTVLDNYDIYADVGGNKGVVKTFTVVSDGNLDIDFLRGVQNPTIKGIEITRLGSSTPGSLTASAASLNFGSVASGQSTSLLLTLTNSNVAGGASVTIDPGSATITPSGQPFTIDWGQTTPIVLAPGQSKQVTITYAPTTVASHAATLSIVHSASGSPLQVSLAGTATGLVPISFAKSILGNTPGLDRPTSLQFGPDGRLYVAQQNGLIRAYTIVRNGANDYDVVAVENITHVQQIANHNDDGSLNPNVTTRLVTGILLTGTAANPVLYVNSSDPRIGGGSSGVDLNLDTNSSMISRLTKTASGWSKLDLVRGLPRSEENHHVNGMQLDASTNTLYVAAGGNTNMGAPSNNFSLLPEFALSAAILSVDLNAIGNATYDMPTLDDETRATQNDANDPFGGNDGRNQAKIVPGGPVQVYAPGFRNPYDLLIHSSGRMYTVDNGPNAGWGDVPINEGPQGTATNGVSEPGVTFGDGLHRIAGPGYYGGHPNPTRANVSNKFNAANPQSPVPAANPIEGDFRIPGSENGALTVYPESTNGIAEYGTTNFGGAMKGDLLIASFDNTIKRVKLSADGTQVVLSQNLFANVGFRPLDVTAPAAGPFAGTIWVCDVAQSTITVFEPSGGDVGNPDDFDGDGYTNDDEIANGTDPHSSGDVPPDYDADFISNLTDPNDDNDAFSDATDKFAVDASNGSATPIGAHYGWENEGSNSGGLLGMGFTGLMTNGTTDYASLFDPTKVTAGGAAGVFTIDSATIGTAKGAANSQTQAFQIGVNVGAATTPFVASTSILGPFNGVTPQAGQEMGFYIGTGDQDNFIQLVLSGDNGGSIKLGKEVAGAFTTVASQNLSMPGSGFVELRLTVDPVSDTLQASYSVSAGPFVNLGGATAVPAAWIASVMAVGLIATKPAVGTLPVTWDFLAVEPAAVSPAAGAAKIEVYTGGSLDNASTATAGAIRFYNNSAGGRKIASVSLDLGNSFLPDVVYDPNGTAGDVAGVNFKADSGVAATGQSTHQFTKARDGGFEKLEVFFTDFDPGESFAFRVDIDPTSVKGSAGPGPSNAASISGLELSGATATVRFEDGGTMTGQLFALDEGASYYKVNAEAFLDEKPTPAAPSIMLVGAGTAPTTVSAAAQTIRVTAPVGSVVRLLQTEVALHLAGVPGGGFDIDSYEGNKVVFVRDDVVTIGAGGFADVNVTLRDTLTEGGLNYFAAVVETPEGKTSDISNVLKIALNGLPPGSVEAQQMAPVVADSHSSTAGFDGSGKFRRRRRG